MSGVHDALLRGAAPEYPRGRAQERARFFHSGNAFNVVYPPVPATTFTDAAASAMNATATGTFACDQSAAIGTPFPATTPLMLARYAFIAASDTLRVSYAATGAIWYVIAGSGQATIGGETIVWSAGDVILAPGSVATTFTAGPRSAVLWCVTNEPQLAFDRLVPAPDVVQRIQPVHYPATEIAAQLARVVEAGGDAATSGIALIFSSTQLEASRNLLPTLTLSLNTVPPGQHQRLHRHNSAAVTLILAGDPAHSLVDGERCAWSPYATLVTPAGAPHSHHNDGPGRAMFLIVQDGGLHYHARTMDFVFLETEA